MSVSRARSLERRIDRLEAQVARAPSAADVARIEGRLQAVEATADLDAYSRADALEAAIDDLPRRPIRSGMSTGVDLRARLRAGIASMNVEQHLREHISTPIRGGPRITLEEFDGDEVVVRIGATPRNPADGPQLASEVLRAVAPFVRAGD